MSHFPEDHELVAFFEAEPTLLDPNEPWPYNTLEFVTVRGGIEVRCTIGPACQEFMLRLAVGGHGLLDVAFELIAGMQLESRGDREALLLSVRREHDFVLQLKPFVHVGWSNLA